MIVGIDSGFNKCYTGCVSGNEHRISELYSEIENIMKEININPPFRWTSLKTSHRESIAKKIVEVFNKSKVKFTLIIHRNKYALPMRELIYQMIPLIIAQSYRKSLESSNSYGKIVFEVDNDFNTRDTKTSHFINKILVQIISLFTSKLVKIREKNGVYSSVFNKDSGGGIILIGRVSDFKTSKSIQIADLLIGCFRERIRFDYEKAFIKSLC